MKLNTLQILKKVTHLYKFKKKTLRKIVLKTNCGNFVCFEFAQER